MSDRNLRASMQFNALLNCRRASLATDLNYRRLARRRALKFPQRQSHRPPRGANRRWYSAHHSHQ